MKTIVLLVAVVTASRVGAASVGPKIPAGETARATDLLRAESLAERAERRLRMPHAAGGGWVKGGTGWTTKHAPASDPAPTVNIHVGSTRRPRPRLE